jgi:DUF4097 and DUF4098 domain-containing protein YvlB
MDRTFETPEGADLEIRIPAGRIDVRNEARGDTVVEIRGERDANDLRVERLDRAGRALIVIAYQSRRLLGGGRDLDVRVQVPTGAAVQTATGSADLDVTGDAGAIAFRSGSGSVVFERSRGDVTIKVASGDVAGRHVDGDVDVHSASGDVRIADVRGTVSCSTASGDVAIGEAAGSVNVNSASGDVRVAAVASGSIRARTMSGDVSVGVLRGTRVWLDLASVGGDTVSELDLGDDAGGEAMAELHLSSMSGDVRVHRAQVAG